MKRDQYYPFKKGDEIQIIKEEGNGYVELKSSKKKYVGLTELQSN